MSIWQRIFGLGRGGVKLSDTPALVAELAGAGATMPISFDRALKISTAWACIRLLAETVGTLPCVLYRREGEQGKVPVRDNQLYTILHDSPNADFTAVEYWERVVADLCGWGNHFSEKFMSGSGRVNTLNPLKPSLIDCSRDNRTGKIRYMYADPVRGWREIPEENIFHVRGFGTTESDVLGLSPISYARVSLNIAVSTDEVAANTYKNGMRPTGVISTEKTLTPEQREQEREWVSKMAGGLKGAGGLLVLEGGYQYNQLSMNPADAQMLENRSFNVEDICRWFRVPPYLVGHTEKSTSWGTGLEQQNTGFATYTLRPYLSRIESAIKKWLIPLPEQSKYVAEFNLEGLLRADSAGRSAFYRNALQDGWMCRDDVRAKENMSKIPGGDIFTVQANLIPLDMVGDATRFNNRRASDNAASNTGT